MKPRPWLAAAGIFLVWVVGAAALPIVQDEAYYFAWARHLSLGYFDHPPLVALMSLTARDAAGSPLAARSGTLVVAALTLLAGAHFFRAVGLSTKKALTVALLLAFGNCMGLVFGFLATPDTGMLLAWTLALAEAAYALRGQEKRWLTAGLATGLGLWAKYTMLLIGPVFLWALIARTRQAPKGARVGLKSPWPYLGGVAALIVILPHLLWNAQHDWITVRFQLRHGLATEHMAVADDGALPRSEAPEEDGPEYRIAAPFVALETAEEEEERAPHVYDAALKSLNRYLGYYGSQLGLWGATGVAVLLVFRRRRRREKKGDYTPPVDGLVLAPAARPLAVAAAAVPLIVFGVLSLGTKVEANWSAMYVIGAAALLTPAMIGAARALGAAFFVNTGLVVLGLIHAHTGFLATRPHRDRLMLETHGYPQLARVLAALEAPVFADSYQLTAMMSFHAPAVKVRQWPGITRDSEFIRNPEFSDVTAAQLRRHGVFWLVTTDAPPPHLSGFFPVEMTQLRDCKDDGLQVITSHSALLIDQRCKKPIHEWYLVRYLTEPHG